MKSSFNNIELYFVFFFRIARTLKYPVLFGGYLYLVHWGWQKLQYNPVVNQGKEPDVINLDKFKKVSLLSSYTCINVHEESSDGCVFQVFEKRFGNKREQNDKEIGSKKGE